MTAAKCCSLISQFRNVPAAGRDFVGIQRQLAAQYVPVATLPRLFRESLFPSASVNYLLRPINELQRAATAIGSGNLAFRVIVPRSGHELSRLVSAFNRMTASLIKQ